MRQRKMKQQKMKQRKSKQSKSLAKILTLGIAAATVVSSMSVPGGLLAPETVYASDNTGTAESPAAVHQAVPPTADLKLLRHRRKQFSLM